jgi:hypothetical protein
VPLSATVLTLLSLNHLSQSSQSAPLFAVACAFRALLWRVSTASPFSLHYEHPHPNRTRTYILRGILDNRRPLPSPPPPYCGETS